VYLAAARIGAIMAGLGIQSTFPELDRLARLARPRLMVVLGESRHGPLAAPLKPLFDSMDFVEAYVIIGSDPPHGAHSLWRWMETERLDMQGALARRDAEISPGDGALIVFTSGSTGTPKAAVLTHRGILSNILVQAREFGYRQDDRVLQNKPMNHVGGRTNLTLPTIAVGATLVFMEYFHPARALAIVQHERISILGQVPTMFIVEMNLTNFDHYDLSSVRLAIVGGAATPVPIMHQITKMADTVITEFGMTETGGYITYTRVDDPPGTFATSVGAVAPEFELRIVDHNRWPVLAGNVGEVAIRGSCLLKEYFGNPEATTQSSDADGWFYSGDLGFLDARDYLTLVDRKTDMYITGGYNVYPREVELHISGHPKVALVAVIGTADRVMGEVGAACVVPLAGASITVEDIAAYCTEGLAQYKIPRYIILRKSLPLTPLGKIDKPRLRREVLHNGRGSD